MFSLLYGIASYSVFLAVFLYAVGFVANVAVPKSIDSGSTGSLIAALAVNAALLSAFALQHSIMARKGFKAWITRYIPKPVERSTYVLAASLLLALLYWQWQPLPQTVWSVQSEPLRGALFGLYALGWATVLIATTLVNHFELFGLRQVFTAWKGQPFHESGFRTPALYKLVRHPIYMGFVVAFWATPDMTAGHLFFAIMTTGYILVGIQFEERDLIRQHGDRYRAYREQVRMLVPLPKPQPESGTRAASVR